MPISCAGTGRLHFVALASATHGKSIPVTCLLRRTKLGSLRFTLENHHAPPLASRTSTKHRARGDRKHDHHISSCHVKRITSGSNPRRETGSRRLANEPVHIESRAA